MTETEVPMDLSRPSPPALIPIRRFKGGLPPRREIREVGREVRSDAQVHSDPDDVSSRPPWSCDAEARLRVPTVTAHQAKRKVLRVCVNNNSIPASNAAPMTTESQMSAILSGDRSTLLSESASEWSWLANLSRSRSVPNVAQSSVEVCPRRKAMSEERVTEGSDEGYDKPRKRRRHYESPECSGDTGGSEQAWRGQPCRKSLSGRHIRSGTGAAPATLKSLREKILSRKVSAATDVR